MTDHQIFDDSFEKSWGEFDEGFREALLGKIRELGSLHRLIGDPEEINADYGRRFYDALEATLAAGKFIEKWKRALRDPLPQDVDALERVFQIHSVYPLHAFYLLLVFVHEHPLPAFFSGRDLHLPFNTLTLKFEQALSDPLPTGVDYELDLIRLDRCPGLGYASEAQPPASPAAAGAATAMMQSGSHPQHHWKDLIWVWHFAVPPTELLSGR
ncbi:MAG TPA: hypothetical protein VFN87_07705 [Solirubrobacteraceae bacterium]|nr:hypothetical protein [Solirubrobacteraceae bacterium]